jgi:hypothetical protein
VVFARFELMKPYFAMTSVEIKDRYQIVAFPTVMMFVNGREVHRWAMIYDLDDYRRNIDAVLARAGQSASPATPPAQPGPAETAAPPARPAPPAPRFAPPASPDRDTSNVP